MKTNTLPVALTIAGFDPSGGAGIIADIRTFSSFGMFPIAAITSITFQNTTGVYGAIHQPTSTVRSQIELLAEDFDIACVKTGMLPTAEIVEEVANMIDQGYLPPPVVDPVIRSSSGFPLIDKAAVESLIDRLVPIAQLVTPNIPEAELMSGIRIRTEEEMLLAGRLILAKGAKAVLIKGGHLETPLEGDERPSESSDLLTFGETETWFRGPRYVGQSPHGTGCVLSAAIATGIGQGLSITDAVRAAKSFVTETIQNAPSIGHGVPPMNPISPDRA